MLVNTSQYWLHGPKAWMHDHSSWPCDSNIHVLVYTVVSTSFDGKKLLWFSQTAKIKHMKFFHIGY